MWSYPETATLGISFFRIPVEELFFFFIQTYITSLLYLLLSKPVLGAAYLAPPAKTYSSANTKGSQFSQQTEIDTLIQNSVQGGDARKITSFKGGLILVSLILYGAYILQAGGNGTYMGLILVWACPVLLMLW